MSSRPQPTCSRTPRRTSRTCPRSPRSPRSAVTCREPLGAFYAYPSVKGLLGKELRGRRPTSSVELAELALEEAEVAVVPGEAFGTPGYLRLSYALGDEDLVEGVSRLQKLLGEARD